MVPKKSHNTISELLPAYALQCLDKEDEQVVADHLADCAQCRAELASFDSVVDRLPLATPEFAPGSELKARLMTRIKSAPMVSIPTPTRSLAVAPAQGIGEDLADLVRRVFHRPAWQFAAWLLVVFLGAGNVLLWQEAQQAGNALSPWHQIILNAQGDSSAATGIVVISADGEYGTLIVDRLPEMGADQQYQLWLSKEGNLVNGGVFSVHEDGYYSFEIEVPEPLIAFDSFAITIEPAGGSSRPTGEEVLTGDL